MRPTEVVKANTVVELLEVLGSADVRAWVDGGWGVDALIGRQTRHHEDLDLVVAFDDVERIKALLGRVGFVISEDELPVRFVLAHAEFGRVDFHTVTFDSAGGGLQPQPSGGVFRYPPEGFVIGRIGGRRVGCVSAAVQVLCHLGYEPTEKDVGDMLALNRELGVALPEPYGGVAGGDAV